LRDVLDQRWHRILGEAVLRIVVHSGELHVLA
jgi:hypothetical protein